MNHNHYRDEIAEEAILFVSVVKWVFLATVIGCLVGASTALFLWLLDSSTREVSSLPYSIILLPVAFLLSSYIISTFAPDAEGHGTEKVIEAVHERGGNIPLRVVPVKLVATIVTLACGGSAGKEGPAAQIGAGISAAFSRLFSFEDLDRKKLVICGISAGFSSVFGTPIAGAIFGVEVLFVGNILYSALMPAFIAGIVGYHVSASLGTQYAHHPLSYEPVFSQQFFLEIILAGVFFGACSFLLIEILRIGRHVADSIPFEKPLKALIGGVALMVLATVFSPAYLGLGTDTIQAALHGNDVEPCAFLVKAVATSITLNFGGSGGIVTPIFYIGATAGSSFAHALGLDVATFASIGFVSLLAGATNAPIAASIMAVELFGPEIGPYAAIACIISFLLTGHRSVYPSQRLATSKSSSLDVDSGEEMDEDIEVKFKKRRHTLSGKMLSTYDRVRDKE